MLMMVGYLQQFSRRHTGSTTIPNVTRPISAPQAMSERITRGDRQADSVKSCSSLLASLLSNQRQPLEQTFFLRAQEQANFSLKLSKRS